MSTAFLICTEKPIEKASLMLVQSIRDLGGTLADCPIYSFQPRPGYEVSQWVLDRFKTLQVEHITEPLNRKYSRYPQGNKPLAGAFAEANFPHDNFIFCDSDKLIVNDLSSALDLHDKDIALRPTHGKGIGCEDSDDPNTRYWTELWKELGIVEPQIRVETTVGRENIFGYWNSGLIIVKRDSGILGQWKQLFELVNERPIEPAAGTFFLDQIVLAAALHTRPQKVATLPIGFNYPIHRHYLGEMPADLMVNRTQDLYSVHYHGLIRDPFFLNMFDSFTESSNLKQWFQEQVYRYKIHPHDQVIKRSFLRLKMLNYRFMKKHNLR